MPLYMFHCRQCGEGFELYLRVGEAGETQACPFCRSPDTELIDDPAGPRRADGTEGLRTGPQGTS